MPIHHRPPPSGLLAAARQWSQTDAPTREQEMHRRLAMAGQPGYPSIGPPQSRMSRIWENLRHGIPRRTREFLEPETPAEMGGLLAASVMPGVGEAIDVADFAAGWKDRDLGRMGWATGGLFAPFVAGSTMRKVLGKGAKAADELPMDEASRMARATEQGFTTDAFHGTSRRPWNRKLGFTEAGGDIRRFNWGSHFGTKEAANDRLRHLRIGGWTDLTANPTAGERVIPVKIKGKFLDLGGESAWTPEGLLRAAQEKGALTASEVEHAFDKIPEWRVRQAELGPNYDKIKHNEEVDTAIRQAVTDLFQKKGFAGVSYTNAVEDIGSTSYMVFDPANIRSSMAARFDPAQAESASLIAGGAGLLATGAVREQRERR